MSNFDIKNCKKNMSNFANLMLGSALTLKVPSVVSKVAIGFGMVGSSLRGSALDRLEPRKEVLHVTSMTCSILTVLLQACFESVRTRKEENHIKCSSEANIHEVVASICCCL